MHNAGQDVEKKSGGILSTDSILQKEIITLRKEIICI